MNDAAPGDGARLLAALAELPGEESLLLRRRYGIGANPPSESAIAREFGVSIAAIGEMEKQALLALALCLLGGAGVFDPAESAQ